MNMKKKILLLIPAFAAMWLGAVIAPDTMLPMVLYMAVYFGLLMLLMRASPAVVHRGRLEEALWRDSPPDSDSLRTHIHQIRQVVDKPFATPLLHTVHGIGYQMRAGDDA